MPARPIDFLPDYGFRPVPPLFAAIPEVYHPGLESGILLLRRGGAAAPAGAVAPGEWQVVSGQAVLCRLDAAPDLTPFIPLGPARGAPAGKYLQYYRVDAARLARHRRRLVQAERAANWFNRQAGAERHRVENLSDAAVVVLALAHDPAACLWMYRSLAEPVRELVRAGHGAVLPEGRFIPNCSAVPVACRVQKRRHICLRWLHPDAAPRPLAYPIGPP
jgi:hypothetical protein